MAFDAESKTVFVTLQQSGRLAAFDLATQTLKWNVPVGNTPAGVLMLPDDKRLLVALTGEDGIVGRRSEGRHGQGHACRPARARTISGPRAMAVTGS